MDSLTVVEFYSGIGGTHLALKNCKTKVEVSAAFEINTSANTVYRYNFPDTRLLQRNIEGVTAAEMDSMRARMWTMSPPCQPFTRLGKQEASDDPRSRSFANLMAILENMQNPPHYIFMENVKGFETSDTYHTFVSVLKKRGYHRQSFLLSPIDFGVPNSRLRFYLVARLDGFSFSTTEDPLTILTKEKCDFADDSTKMSACDMLREKLTAFKKQCIGDVIDDISNKTNAVAMPNNDINLSNTTNLVPRKMLLRYFPVMDIVNRGSTRSCCFTKGYSKLVEGAGSFYTEQPMEIVKKVHDRAVELGLLELNQSKKNTAPDSSKHTPNNENIVCESLPNDETYTTDSLEQRENEVFAQLDSLQLCFFSPQEVARLMNFPAEFSFPDETTDKQKYRLLGNSVNVCVVQCVISWFLLQE